MQNPLNIHPVDIITAIKAAISAIPNVSNEERKKLIAVGLGKNLATALDLPNRIEGSMRIWYETSHAQFVNKVISEVNEVYLIDTALAQETCFMWFEFRYMLVYNPQAYASFIDRLALWSEGIIPDAVKDLAVKVTSNAEANDAFRNLINMLHTGVVLANEVARSTEAPVVTIGG